MFFSKILRMFIFQLIHLRSFFRFSENIHFIDLKFYDSLSENDLISFFKQCGVQDYPWVIDFDPNFSEQKKQQLRLNSIHKSSEITYYQSSIISNLQLEGLNDISLKNYYHWKIQSSFGKFY